MLAERVKDWTKTWEQQGLERGMEKGLERGLERGRMEGRMEGELQVLRKLLIRRFGPLLNEAALRQIKTLYTQ